MLMQPRSAASIGCKGSSASGMPISRARSQQLAQLLDHHGARRGDILARFAAGAGELRQAARHDDEAGRAQRRRLVEGAAVVLARRRTLGAIGDHHAAAAIAGEDEARHRG